ncbi:MAG: D-alanyl-D-alanine carboxypeptidase family protein [Gaiellaceae bacterium]
MKLRLLGLAVFLSLTPSALAAGPSVQARAYLIVDGRDGHVLAAEAPREKLPVASLTKLMTVLVALERARPSTVVTVSPLASSIGESSINLRGGERITVHDLVEACLIQSANDAAWALAYHAGRGDAGRFVRVMNIRARQWGLKDTHFVRPDGLDAFGHVSSARDVTELARIAMRNPLIRSLVDEQTETISGGRRLYTWNDLLGNFPGLVGVKTGHTRAAGWSQVAAARGTGVTVYATLLGGPTRSQRNTDLATLLRYGLERFRLVQLVRSGHVYAEASTPYGRGTVGLVSLRPVRYAARVDQRFVERIVVPTEVELPVQKSDPLGEVRVFDDGRMVARAPLVASRSVTSPGPLQRARWYSGETARNVWSWIS